jgi:hypothetical protein
MRDYNHYKAKFHNTKPIRGRDEEVRPIGERRRTHETITQKKLLSGETSYCARLYSTDCVEYHNNGDITLRTGSWETPSTADFIHEHSPFTCFKQNNRLWVRVVDGNSKQMLYPVGDELTLRSTDAGGGYEPVNKVLIKKRVVDRDKAKAAREPVMPFLQWSKAFLSMSDGWLMNETRKQVIELQQTDYGPRFMYRDTRADTMYEHLTDLGRTDDDYLRIMLTILRDKYEALEHRVAESFVTEREGYQGKPWKSTTEFYDLRFDYEFLKRKVYKIVDEAIDITKVIEVEPTGKTMSGVIR